jgi:hypothetical protein
MKSIYHHNSSPELKPLRHNIGNGYGHYCFIDDSYITYYILNKLKNKHVELGNKITGSNNTTSSMVKNKSYYNLSPNIEENESYQTNIDENASESRKYDKCGIIIQKAIIACSCAITIFIFIYEIWCIPMKRMDATY